MASREFASSKIGHMAFGLGCEPMRRDQTELVLAQLLFVVSSIIAGVSCSLALFAVYAPMYEGATIWDALAESWPLVVQTIPFMIAALWQGVRLRAWSGRLRAMPALGRLAAMGRTLGVAVFFGCITYALTVLGNAERTVAILLIPVGAAAVSFQVMAFLLVTAGVVKDALHRRPARGHARRDQS